MTFSGTTATINPNSSLESSTAYYVQTDQNAIQDQAGNFALPIADKTTWNFTVKDYLAPSVLTYVPANGATEVEVSGTLVVTFNEAVVKNSGFLYIKRVSDNALVRSIDFTGAAVTVSGSTVSIVYTGLPISTPWYVTIDNGSLKDSAGNLYPGISDTTTWGFTTSGST